MGKLLDNRINIINAALSTGSTYKKSGSEYFKNKLQQKIDKEFQYASTFYTIQEELNPGTNIYTDTQVRIEHVVKNELGQKLGDDFRGLIFKNIDHIYGLGYRYRFNNNIWITVFSDFYKFPTASATIRRANYTLKWINDVGKLIEEPCIIEYFKLTMNSIDEAKNIRTGTNQRYIYFQNNSETYKIIRDKRFIIDRRAYRVVDYDSVTFKSTNPGLYELTLEEHQYNSAIDLLYPDGTGIANYYGNSTYSIELSMDTISLAVGGSITLSWIVKYGGVVVNDKQVNIESNENFVTISNVGNNSVTILALAEGSTTLNVSLVGNDSVSDSLDITIDAMPSENISEFISGSSTINTNESANYEIHRFVNSIDDGSQYTFSLNSSLATLINIGTNTTTVVAGNNLGNLILTAINTTSLEQFTFNIEITSLW
jgi:hypothetical protein